MDRSFPFSQVIVIGGTGQTGHRVLQVLLERSNLRLVATSRAVDETQNLPTGPLAPTILGEARVWGARVRWRPLDLEAEPARLGAQLSGLERNLIRGEPTALIFAAAFTNVEACETAPAYCERVNVANTIAVMDWAKREFGARLVFYSTDYVFDGAAGPYAEESARHALSAYGQSKVDVELWLERHVRDALILRTTGVYDLLPGSKNFLMQLRELWGAGKVTRIPSDQFANPVWAFELARATIELLERECSGIYHAAGAAQLARLDFARLIARVFGFDQGLIQPTTTDELLQKAKRPLKGGLKCDKLRRELGWAPAGPEETLPKLK